MLFINFVPAIEVIFLNRNDSTEKRYFKQVCKSPEKLLGEEDFGAFFICFARWLLFVFC